VRPIGEVTLVALGFAAGYTLFFWLMRTATKSIWLGGIGLVVLLVTMPKFYKYYIVLGPAWVLAAMWFYSAARTRARLWLVGVAIAFIGLYRPDYGVYGMLAATTLLAVDTERSLRERLIDVAYLAMTVVVAASPWLIYVTVRGGLGRYLYESSIGSLDQAVGQLKALPVFNFKKPFSSNSQLAVLYYLLFAAPVIAAVLLILNWRRTAPIERPRLTGMIVLGALTLVQAVNRAGYSHLIQAIPPDVLIITWLVSMAVAAVMSGKIIAIRIGAAGGLAASGVAALLLLHMSAAPFIKALHSDPPSKLAPFVLPRDSFVDRVEQMTKGKDSRINALVYLRDCSQPDDRVLGWPYGLNVYYFDNRLAGNRILGFSPGFYSAPDQQQTTIAELKVARPKFWIYKPFLYSKGLQYIQDYEPLVAAYLKQAYEPVKAFGDTTILIYRDYKDQFQCAAQP